VYRRVLILVEVAAILLMTAPQLCELFDRWDSITDFGNDTEFMLIVVGICIGLCLLSALLIVQLARRLFSVGMLLSSEAAPGQRSQFHPLEYERLLFSPPLSLTSLRI
jgi:hypothetical protein